MSDDDAALDRKSRHLLSELEHMRHLEREKRGVARSSPEFHKLAEEVEDVAREVWRAAKREEEAGREDSPIAAERDEQEPGDWTQKADN